MSITKQTVKAKTRLEILDAIWDQYLTMASQMNKLETMIRCARIDEKVHNDNKRNNKSNKKGKS